MSAATRLFAGSPIATVDTVNGPTNSLAGLDCSGGVRAGAKCFNRGTDGVSALQYFTLQVSAAVVDHITVEAALGFPTHRWILDTTGGTGVTSLGSADGSIVITNPTTTPDLSENRFTFANRAALAAFASAPTTVGTIANVLDLGDGQPVYYTLRQDARAADGKLRIAASGKAGFLWVAGDGKILTRNYQSAKLDLTATFSGTAFIPSLAGFFGIFTCREWLVTATGVATGAPTTQAGNDAAQTNVIAPLANPSVANINLAIAAGQPNLFLFSGASGVAAQVDLGTPVTLKNAGATGTGGFTLAAYAIAFVTIFSTGDFT